MTSPLGGRRSAALAALRSSFPSGWWSQIERTWHRQLSCTTHRRSRCVPTGLSARFGAICLTQRQLHDDAVEPAAELVADRVNGAAELEARPPVQADGGKIG